MRLTISKLPFPPFCSLNRDFVYAVLFTFCHFLRKKSDFIRQYLHVCISQSLIQLLSIEGSGSSGEYDQVTSTKKYLLKIVSIIIHRTSSVRLIIMVNSRCNARF